MPDDFDPKKGTVSRAVAVCPVCGGVVEAKLTRQLFQEGRAGERMLAVVTHKSGVSGKRYRIAIGADLELFQSVEEIFSEKRNKLTMMWGLNPVPDEVLPLMSGVFNVPIYGMQTWGALFNTRQQLALITFVEKVKEAYHKMVVAGFDVEYARAVASYLALALVLCHI